MITHQNLALHFGSKSVTRPASCDYDSVDDDAPLFSDTSDVEEDLGSRWVPPNSVNGEDDYHSFFLKKDSYLLLVPAAGRHCLIRSDDLMCLGHKFSHCNMVVIRVTSWENFCQNVPGDQRGHIFLTTFPALLITSNWSTYCSLIADHHASKRQLFARHRQKRERRFGLHQKPSGASAFKISFWMTKGFLPSPTIMTMRAS